MIIVTDLSHWNIEGWNQGKRYDYATVAKNANGVIYKCSDLFSASAGRDWTYAESFDGFSQVMPVGSYLFHRPTYSYKDNVDHYMMYRKPGFIDALDVEDFPALPNIPFRTNVRDTLEEMTQRLGHKPWLYSNMNGLDNYLTNAVEIAPWIAGIWLANPNLNPGVFGKPKYYGKNAIGLHQYTWTGSLPGIVDKTIDLSLWNWTDEQWADLVGLVPAPPAPTPETVEIPKELALKIKEWAEEIA